MKKILVYLKKETVLTVAWVLALASMVLVARTAATRQLEAALVFLPFLPAWR